MGPTYRLEPCFPRPYERGGYKPRRCRVRVGRVPHVRDAPPCVHPKTFGGQRTGRPTRDRVLTKQTLQFVCFTRFTYRRLPSPLPACRASRLAQAVVASRIGRDKPARHLPRCRALKILKPRRLGNRPAWRDGRGPGRQHSRFVPQSRDGLPTKSKFSNRQGRDGFGITAIWRTYGL